ncbi:alpha/beta fold hydrolase [Xanthovirga aplysinae]|uniref:alpha/beta fold hydrolase n=1 Tax=Xanthovirga aplysinae TaxID=2529853 RepID=UPI0012BC077B|nr:alpha/beta hydrolase [Xanthovirga aplysinae]MTI31450.1 alpha/beta hydrolase [Xanthovirga aplysinae]
MKNSLLTLLTIITMSVTSNAQTVIPHYTLKGEGEKKVIVLHDWMGDTQGNWKFAMDYLDLENYTYAFLDVRGYGQSKDIKGQFTIEEIASDYFAVADKLGWERFFIVAHSINGMASQRAVLNDKENRIIAVVALTPVSSAGFPVDEETKTFFESMIVDVDAAATGYGMLVSDKLPKKWNYQRARRWHTETNKDAVRSYMTEWLTNNFYEDTKGIEKPFLVIYGEDDLPAWREEGQKEAFKYFKNVEIKGVANAGHYPMQQVPAYTVNLIETYFSRF